jgi:hypothetical protein
MKLILNLQTSFDLDDRQIAMVREVLSRESSDAARNAHLAAIAQLTVDRQKAKKERAPSLLTTWDVV